MSELPSPSSGPSTPTETPTPPLPGGIIRLDSGVDLQSLSPEDLQAQIVARERDMKYQIQAIQGELTDLVEDINIGGRPLSDRIRAKPLVSLALSGGAGALLGIGLGLLKRRRRTRRDAPDDALEFTRARLAMVLDEAAYKVARGAKVEDAVRSTLQTTPAVYMDRDPREPVPKSAVQENLGVVLKTAFGFATKAAMDQLTQQLTGKKEVFDALEDA